MTLPAPRPAPRSFLFVPGDSDRFLARALETGADALVIDLEDAVPAAQKAEARQKVARWLQEREAELGPDAPEVWVRINPLAGGLWRPDVEAVVAPGLTGLRLPKAESAAEIEGLGTRLGELERRAGLAAGSIELTCTLESALGLWRIAELVEAPRVRQLAFGEADFVADIGAVPTARSTLFARSQLVVASRVGQLLPPVAPVYTHLDDEEGLVRTSEESRDLGFGGRSCIHPRQLEPIHRVFTPDPRAVAAARATVDGWERSGGGGITTRSSFVDEAVIRRARSVLARAEAYGVLAETPEEGAR